MGPNTCQHCAHSHVCRFKRAIREAFANEEFLKPGKANWGLLDQAVGESCRYFARPGDYK